MTQWGLDTLFNPAKRHMDEEKRRLQSTREEVGDASGGKRIDLESGKVTIQRATDEDETAEDDAEATPEASAKAAPKAAAKAVPKATAKAAAKAEPKAETDAQRRARLRRARARSTEHADEESGA